MATANCTSSLDSGGLFESASIPVVLNAGLTALVWLLEHRDKPGPAYPAVVDAFELLMLRVEELANELDHRHGA